MTMSVRQASAFVSFLLFTLSPAAADQAKLSVAAQIDAMATQTLREKPVWGFSIAAARGERVIFARGYGRDGSGNIRATANTVYHIDSVTKNITAAALLRLADRGQLHLSDPVSKYVPDVPPHARQVLLRQLLNHTSGIKSFTDLATWNSLESRPMSRSEILGLLRDQPLDFRPGGSWRYTNSGFYLAGLVIERASGESYGAYMRQLFGKIGMNHSSFGCAGVLGHEVKEGHSVPAKLIDWGTTFSAGGVCSSASDLLLWEGALQSGRVVSPQSLARMIAPTHLPDGTMIDYGFGVRRGSLSGHPVLGHTGSGGGFNAVLQYYPRDHLTVAVLANGSSGFSANEFAANTARIVLALPHPAMPKAKRLRRLALNRYVGMYDSAEGRLQLFDDNSSLAFRRPEQQQPLGTMTFEGDDTFAVAPDVVVRFTGRGRLAEWGISYEHGLMMDAKRRVN